MLTWLSAFYSFLLFSCNIFHSFFILFVSVLISDAPGECHKSVKNCRYCAPGHERLCQICELGYSHQKTAVRGRKNVPMGGTGRKCGKCPTGKGVVKWGHEKGDIFLRIFFNINHESQIK